MTTNPLNPLHVAVLSMHTSPLAQPGTGDGGGMNVYVRELSTALARAGVECDVFTRADRNGLAPTVNIEPGLRVHHVEAGPVGPVMKEDLAGLTSEFAVATEKRLCEQGVRPTLIHANYWLSAMSGHQMKHSLNVPLVSTFHTLARVKLAANDFEPEERARAEASVIGCSDLVLANTMVEADELVRFYDADPNRIAEVPLGVDHAFFSPGNPAGARAALGLGSGPVMLFVGRIQPLKGVELAIRAFAASKHKDAQLVIVGGPSGIGGLDEVARMHCLTEDLGIANRVRFCDPQPHHILSTYYRAADVCLVPSRSESFGLVALEAAACGIPVVASNVGGLQTLVDHGETGALITERDPELWAATIDRILDTPFLASMMGQRAATRSLRYAWSYTGARLRRLYADLAVRQLVDCP
jgi:D-inositol-3-phosphate glycosyltransferase